MVYYSFTTVLMSVLTSNLMIILIALCFQNKQILQSIGYRVLIAFLFMTLIRFVIPFELPVARNIYFPKVISTPLTYLRYPFLRLPWMSVSAWTLLEIVWVIGILYHLRRYVGEHVSVRRQLIRYSVDITDQEPYASLLADICGHRKNSFRIFMVDGITTPSVFGIMKPRILIPNGMQLSDDDFFYVMRHETSHHFHHDLFIKRVVNILAILYWWNPACRLFKKQVDLLLEIRVDGTLVKRDSDTAKAYLRTLIKIAEESVRLKEAMDIKLPENLLLSMSKESTGPLTCRFDMIRNIDKRPWHVPLTLCLFTLVFAVYLGSYFVTFENRHIIDQFLSDDFSSGNGIYAVLKDDGTYDIYCNNLLIENTSSLEYYSKDIPIYNQ